MKELKKIKITILGKDYSISTDEREEDICRAAMLVDTLMREITGNSFTGDISKVAVLVALRLANDMEKNRKELSLWNDSISQKLDLLLNKDTKLI